MPTNPSTPALMLDRRGQRLERGARVTVELPMFSGPYTVVVLYVHEGRGSVGLYRGPLEEYEPNFCIPYAPALPSGDDFMARDLELIAATEEDR